VDYHWIISLFYPASGDYVDADGVQTVRAGDTRQRVYQDIRQYAVSEARKKTGYRGPANVLFFSLEPN
jgi:hypothetical protein